MKIMKILTLLVALCAVAQAAGGVAPAIKTVDFAKLIQKSAGPGDKKMYEKGKKEPFTGFAVRTYTDGRKTRTQFVSGVANGLSTIWHANGKKSMEVTMVEGKPHGDMIIWDAKGKELSRTKYVNGKKTVQP